MYFIQESGNSFIAEVSRIIKFFITKRHFTIISLRCNIRVNVITRDTTKMVRIIKFIKPCNRYMLCGISQSYKKATTRRCKLNITTELFLNSFIGKTYLTCTTFNIYGVTCIFVFNNNRMQTRAIWFNYWINHTQR